MGTQRVGIREFRDKLATYVLEAEGPVAITRHGETVGHYVPVQRRRPTEEQIARVQELGASIRKQLKEAGSTEDDVIADLQQLRQAERGRNG
jgi:antitoxin (DNA-binding transcriptional repressor) of toxin-antitoxin stability system